MTSKHSLLNIPKTYRPGSIGLDPLGGEPCLHLGEKGLVRRHEGRDRTERIELTLTCLMAVGYPSA